MKYEPEIFVKVFEAVKELGNASREEVQEYLKDHEKVELDLKTVERYLRKWKDKKDMSAAYFDGKVIYKLSDIPPWYTSGIMAIVHGTSNVDMRAALDALEERRKDEGRIITPKSVWGDYHRAQVEFENLDPLLGGWDQEEAGEMTVPSVDGKKFVPANWFKGWLRSNAGLVDLPQSICHHVQVESSELADFKEGSYRLKVLRGMATYQAIPKGTKFKGLWRFPLKGSKFKTMEQWRDFLADIGEHPLRGLGANPFALGGRVKLVSFKEANPQPTAQAATIENAA